MRCCDSDVLRLLFATLITAIANLAVADDTIVNFARVGDDLEIAEAQIDTGGLFNASVVLVRTALRRYNIAAILAADGGSDVRQMCQDARAIACVNANFFDADGKALGLVVSRGITRHKLHLGGRTLSGVLALTPEGVRIAERDAINLASVSEAIQAGPLLIQTGVKRPISEKSTSTRRAGVCLDDRKRLVLFAISSSFSGVSINALQDLLESKGVGCREALNLDGGGSAQLFVSPHLPGAAQDFSGVDVQGRDQVPVALGLIAR